MLSSSDGLMMRGWNLFDEKYLLDQCLGITRRRVRRSVGGGRRGKNSKRGPVGFREVVEDSVDV